MKYILLIVSLLGTVSSLQAQDSTSVGGHTPTDTLPTKNEADALLADLTDSSETQPLLPHKMIFTQRALWGKKGLLRAINVAPLTTEGRAHELKVRRTMLVAHQVAGFVTLAGFVAQGLLGAKLYNAKGQEYVDTKQWHERMAGIINVTYGTTMVLSLGAPPPMIGAKRGFTTIKLHKYLAIVHITGMVATNILAHMIDSNPELKPYHRAAAYTTFGAFAASIVAIKF
ncbi:hypothetical protein GCM10028806_44260 [Spirosoma terrae]|uniref:Cytochrome b561 domain-containing protein n=1 Tax=Spirosoma terrae TaxID=1968276 RepID=A0A6L9L097_9BACT|nr:hypothetical protein [Spirosoma terrae]NDU93906.1 hypothetical protein [Spirosoma terrae]